MSGVVGPNSTTPIEIMFRPIAEGNFN